MNELVELVRAYRAASALHVRLRFGEEIVARVGPLLKEFVARRCREEVVDDVLQEVLIAIFKQMDGFRGRTDSQFWRWCYRIACFKTADHFRDQEGKPTLSLDVEEVRRAAEATYVESPPRPGERLDLEEALEWLRRSRPPCVDLLDAHYLKGLGYQELAQVQGEKPATIRMRIKRCLALARKLVGKLK